MKKRKYFFRLYNKNKFYYIYTLLFMLLFFFIFSPFYFEEKSFAWGRDSFTVEYPARKLLCKQVVNFFKKPHDIPGFSFSIGQGLDISSFLNTWYLEPINILMIFFPIDSSEIAFTIICIFYLYLAGLSFLTYSAYLYKMGRACVIGSLLYCFSGFALYYAPRHPCFLAPMVYLPLIFLCIDKMIKNPPKAFFSFVFITFLSLTSSYYFFYINTILLTLYIIVKLVINRSIAVKEKVIDLVFLVMGYITGVGLAAIFFLPAIYFYFSSNRAVGSSNITNYFCYEFSDYVREFIYIIIPYVQDYENWLILGIAPVCVITFFLLFFKRNMIEQKFLSVLGLAFIIFPIFGVVFAAFSSINSRYAYYVIFIFSIVFVAMYDSLYKPCLKVQCIIFLYAITYFFVCIFSNSISKDAAFIGLPLMLLTIIFFLVAQNKYININVRKIILDMVVLITISIGGYSLFHTNFTGYINEFNNSGDINDVLLNSSLENISFVDDNSFYRVAEGKTDTNHLNAAISAQNYHGVNGISLMHNVIDYNMAEFNRLLGNNDYYDRTMICGLDNRKILETLAGVRYYVTNDMQLCHIPDIYSFYNEQKYNNIFMRKPEYDAGLGFLYSNIMSRSEFENLSLMERQEAIVQSAVVDDAFVNKNISLKNKNQYWSEKVPYKMFDMREQEIQLDSGYTISFPGEMVYIDFHVSEKADIYLDFSRPSTGSCTYTSTLNGMEKNINFLEEQSMYDAGQNSFLIYMGCQETGDYRMAIRCDGYEREQVLSSANLAVYIEPTDVTNSFIKERVEHRLQNIRVDSDYISAVISAENDSLLFMSIPYTSKGWKAKVDGKETAILQTNIMYMGIPISQGEHIIELTYTTPYLYVGIGISCAFLLLLIVLYIVFKHFQCY